MARYPLRPDFEQMIGRAVVDPAFCRALLREPVRTALERGWPICEAVQFAGIVAPTLGQFARATMPLVYDNHPMVYGQPPQRAVQAG